MAQPDLDYMAPEIQLETSKTCTVLSDMFALGMVICAIYNQGKAMIQANHSAAVYTKRMEQVRMDTNILTSMASSTSWIFSFIKKNIEMKIVFSDNKIPW